MFKLFKKKEKGGAEGEKGGASTPSERDSAPQTPVASSTPTPASFEKAVAAPKPAAPKEEHTPKAAEAPKAAPKPAETPKAAPKPAEAPRAAPKPAETPKAAPKPAEAPKAAAKPAEAPKAAPKPAEAPKAAAKPAEAPKAAPKPAEAPKAAPKPAAKVKPAEVAHKAAAPEAASKPAHAKPAAATKASKAKDSKVAPMPKVLKAAKPGKLRDPIFESTPKDFRIGGAIRPRVNLSRYVKWPKYVRVQRQRRVLLQRLKIPPAINQFNYTIDKSQAHQLLKLLNKYKPETRKEKASRLLADATAIAHGKEVSSKKPFMLKSGLSHVTNLVEYKKAKLVVIAHDVDPLELVLWLPTLCRKKEVPYCIVKGKSRLGKLVHKKTAAVVAVDNVRKEDQAEFESMVKAFTAMFNDNAELRRRWGGHIMGIKSQHMQAKKEAVIAMENAKKLGLAFG